MKKTSKFSNFTPINAFDDRYISNKSEVEAAKSGLQRIIKCPQNFLLNNILMSVQFFENYERDTNILREKWLKEIALPTHYKKCFYADSLHKLIGNNLKFMYRHGAKKNFEEFLHPFRIFVSYDNIESAFDPGIFRSKQKDAVPNYQFVVKPCENNKKDKSGYVLLVEFKNSSVSGKQHSFREPLFEKNKMNSIYSRKNTAFNVKPVRRLTTTERVIALQAEDSNPSKFKRASIFKNVTVTPEGKIPNHEFYKYMDPDVRLNPRPIVNFKMNNNLQTSFDIPKRCFQLIEIKKSVNARRRSDLRKESINSCFITQTVLNGAAFKGHFCDLLVQKLAGPLGLDPDIVMDGFVHEEFIIINNNETMYYVTPVIEIKDWDKFIEINKKKLSNEKNGKLKWPTDYMRNVIRKLPCNLVTSGYSENLKENLDYEKEWKIIFPKAEEYLLLHMMHSHIRCYIFLLLIYKTYIEPEINTASFNPKHLQHLLFWQVQKNFTAWPEDRPGETLLIFLKILYKKLQNKSLRDFFITTRNLFAKSLPKDLHRTQAIIKMILENPIPYIMKALKNLNPQTDFYATFDISKLNKMLNEKKITGTNKPVERKNENEKKTVTFDDDQERQWRKNVIAQIQLEKKLEEKEELKRLSVDSISTEGIFQPNNWKPPKWCEVLELFAYHFIEMGVKSVEYKALDQGKMYSLQVKRLIDTLSECGHDKEKLNTLRGKSFKLGEKCGYLLEKIQHKPKSIISKEKSTETIKEKQPSGNPKKSSKTETESLIIGENKINKDEKPSREGTTINILETTKEEKLSHENFMKEIYQTKV